ncbi:hypothetical protein GWO43_02020 [candidate division KSB1 bacterium]|nr:hypothetical protein [candidate division KSB1 bacterium]NIR69541.1 hypothetical protein [candidate division KSB1 bacterium]NIS22851.1 hypothetical protein [candidate division KSB1 bacterium]NIT69687.1 hypothetical protein [candidate division KSB1 bacterium]NIU23357.1 hypothetical protein [candidate division KSB1 bacterium]
MRTFAELLANFRGDIVVPGKNRKLVEHILNLAEGQKTLPEDAEFVWETRPVTVGNFDYRRIFLLNKQPELDWSMITSAKASSSGLQSGHKVNLRFNREGAQTLARIAEMQIGQRLAAVMDGEVIAMPVEGITITFNPAEEPEGRAESRNSRPPKRLKIWP